ncbi:MAG TPA: PAS domain S-box protein [Planctomycetota bacterium]|nr:PAS domain S-box protein [Planctomycetota bacterium]
MAGDGQAGAREPEPGAVRAPWRALGAPDHSRLQIHSDALMRASDPVVIEDIGGQILDANACAIRAYEWPRHELIGRSVLTLIAPEYHERAARARELCRRGGEPEYVEWERVTRSGRRIPTLLTLFPVADERDAHRGVVSLAKDITELRRRDLIRRELQYATERAEERERRTLSRDLHDSVGQLLALARIRLAALRERATGGEIAASVAEVSALVGEAEERARTLMFRVNPACLDDLGLHAAVDRLADDLRDQYGLAVTVQAKGDLRHLDDELRSALYRCVRELLINVARHAETRQAVVRLERRDNRTEVTVHDRGRGFDSATVAEGFGLVGVRDRVEHLGGALEVDAAPGVGTRVWIDVPDRPLA